MQLQQTLRKPIEYTAREFYGGNEVRVQIQPANENDGIIFQTQTGRVKAALDTACQSRSSILLASPWARVIHVEHFLATLCQDACENSTLQCGVSILNIQKSKQTTHFSVW